MKKSKGFFHKEHNPQNFVRTQGPFNDQKVSEYVTEILYEDDFEDRHPEGDEVAGNSPTGIRGRFLSMKRWKKIVLCVVTALVVMAAGLTGSFFYLRAQGEKHLKTTVKADPEDESNPEEGLFITYKGKKYKYNEDVINFLCLGIDKEIPIEETVETPNISTGSEGFADAIVIVSINIESSQIKMLAIPRDTIVPVKIVDSEGNFLRNENVQIDLQYAYGTTAAESCELMTDTVSKLLYKVPIQRYCSINLEAISILNDAVGGVDVQTLQDIELQNKNYPANTPVHLTGEMARDYVQERNMTLTGSLERLERQKQYITNYFAAAKEAIKNDMTLPLTLYQNLSEKMCTDITTEDIAYLVPELLNMSMDFENISMIPGEIKLGEVFAEYVVNDEQLKELVVNYFYEEIR